MAADTSTKFYHHTMVGAPVLNGNQGDLVAILDACLINGFNITTPSSLTFSNGTATLTWATAQTYQQNQVIRVSGANEGVFNGDWRVSSISQYSLTFLMDGTPPSSATGGISVKTPPLGFEIYMTGANKRVYRSTNILSPKNLLRVDDSLDPAWTSTYTRKAKVTMVQAGGMYDINTFTSDTTRAPYDPLLPTKNELGSGSGATAYDGWFKWLYAKGNSPTSGSYADSSAVPTIGPRYWTIVGNDRGFYLMNAIGPATATAYDWLSFYMFSDTISYKPGDAFSTVLSASDLYITASQSYVGYPNSTCSTAITYDSTGKLILRSYNGVGGYTGWTIATTGYSSAQMLSGYSAVVPFPYGDNNPMYLEPMYIREYPSTHLRGVLPGIKFIPHNISHPHGTFINTTNELYMLCSIHASVGNLFTCKIAFNLTTPWYT